MPEKAKAILLCGPPGGHSVCISDLNGQSAGNDRLQSNAVASGRVWCSVPFLSFPFRLIYLPNFGVYICLIYLLSMLSILCV